MIVVNIDICSTDESIFSKHINLSSLCLWFMVISRTALRSSQFKVVRFTKLQNYQECKHL